MKVSDNAVLFLWATNPLLVDAMEVVSAWKFQYKTNMVWVKTELQKPGSGFYVRGRHELLFICTRGSFTPLNPNISPPIGSIIEAPVREHSRKPESVYGIIEALYPGCNYVELFSRTSRNGWDSWGNQVDTFVDAE
jgi:N6-adenosine-specific RNA methylase IME4